MTRRLSPAGWSAVLGALAILVWSVPGLLVNPDFATGDAASAETVLGVDMNGWHAVSGFLIAIPALLAAPRPDWAGPVDLAAAGSLIATAIWALADSQPAFGLFSFPNGEADALLHLATASIFLAGGLHWLLVERRSGRPA
jgi:Domain of unknown function (DUF4383)